MTHEEILTMLGDYVDYLIANSSAEAPMWNIEKVRSGKPNKWNYIDGCMITACLSLYHTTGDKKPVIADMVIENILHRKSYRKISKERYIPMNPKDFYGYRRKTVAVLYERMRLLGVWEDE